MKSPRHSPTTARTRFGETLLSPVEQDASDLRLSPEQQRAVVCPQHTGAIEMRIATIVIALINTVLGTGLASAAYCDAYIRENTSYEAALAKAKAAWAKDRAASDELVAEAAKFLVA